MNSETETQVEVPKDNNKENPNGKVDNKLTVQHANGNMNAINLFNAEELAAAENFMTKLMRSDKGGIKSVNDGLAILLRAKDLNIPFSSAIEHIHVINGKTGVDIHIVKALLLKAGCTWQTLKDYQPQYEYTDGINVYSENLLPDFAVKCNSLDVARKHAAENKDDDKIYVYPVKFYQDFNGNIYREYQLKADKFKVVSNKVEAAAVAKEGKVPIVRIKSQPVDYVTQYKIKRQVNGELMESIGTFSYSDAVTADMFSKDTYKKYPRVLIGHRAFTLAARDIASDIIFGCQETTEIKIVNDMNLSDSDIDEQ